MADSSRSLHCAVCHEPESLCRCDENPVHRLASKLVREARDTARATVMIKQCDYLVLCERAYNWANDISKSIVSETASRKPRFIDMATHELCRFDDGQWSLRIKQGDDRAHVRYLDEFEAEMVEAALNREGHAYD